MTKNQARSTAKNAVMLLAGTVVRMGLTFGFIVIAADQMSVSEFGIYAIGVHYFELFLSLAATAIGILLTREIAKLPGHASELTTSAVIFSIMTAIAAGGAMALFAATIGFSQLTQNVLLISSLALIPGAICVVLEAVMVAFERSETVAAAASLEVILRIGGSFYIVFQGWELTWLFVILIVSKSIQLFVLSLGVLGKLGLRMNWNRKRTARFIRRWPTFAAENWMATIYTNLDVLVLSVLTSEHIVGLYSAAWKIVRLGMVVAKTYTTAVFPLLTRIQKHSIEKFNQLNLDTIRLMCVISIPMVAVLIITADRVIGLIYFSGKYAEATPILQVLAAVLILEFLNPFLSHTLFARGKQDKSMYVAAIALIVNSVVTIVLVYQFAAVGAAIGTVVGGAVATFSYLSFALNKSECAQVADSMMRSLLVAGCSGLIAIALRNASWPLLIAGSVAVFAVTAAYFKAVNRADAQIFLSLFKAKTLNN